jgi:tetratricopeptide (TPR) repeat protein
MRDFPEVPRFRRDHGNTLMHRGNALHRIGRLKDAEKSMREAGEVFKKLVRDFPTVPQYRTLEAAGCHNLATVFAQANQLPEAEKAFAESIGILEAQAGRPEGIDAQAQGDLANSYMRLGDIQQTRGLLAEAERSLRRARELYERLHTTAPGQPSSLVQASAASHNLAMLLQERGSLADAEKAFRKSLELGERLQGEPRNAAQARHDRANTWMQLGLLLDRQGQKEQAEKALTEAITLFGRLAADRSDVPHFLYQQSAAHHNFATFLRTHNRLDDAEKNYRKARDILQTLVARKPEVPSFRRDLANSWREIAETLQTRGRTQEARGAYAEAVKLWRELVRKHPGVPDLQAGLSITTGQMLLAEGNHARAAQLATALARSAGERLQDSYNAACLFARCVPVARADSALTAEKQKSVSEGYADEALKLLQLTGRKGFTTAAELGTDPDLKALRGRTDFEALIKELQDMHPDK